MVNLNDTQARRELYELHTERLNALGFCLQGLDTVKVMEAEVDLKDRIIKQINDILDVEDSMKL